MRKAEYVIRKADQFHGIAYSVLYDGIEAWTGGKIRECYETDEFEILSEEEFEKKVEAFCDAYCGNWKETTKERYNDMLDILPPVKWFNGGFFISEAYTLNIHPFHQAFRGKYYEAYFRITTCREIILKSLAAFVETQGKFEEVKNNNINRLKKDMNP